jgi:hypothetical protein
VKEGPDAWPNMLIPPAMEPIHESLTNIHRIHFRIYMTPKICIV